MPIPARPPTTSRLSPPLHPATSRLPARLTWLGALVFVPSLAGTVMRVVPPRDDATALLASFIPYATLGHAVTLTCWLAAALLWHPLRRRLVLAALALLSAVLLCCHLAWLAPLYTDDSPTPPATFRVLTVNVYLGLVDLDSLLTAAEQAEVVVLSETTPQVLAALAERGWRERFPYGVGEEIPATADTAVYSRFPLTDARTVTTDISAAAGSGRQTFAQRITTVAVPGVGSVRVMPVHPCNPYCGFGLWDRQHDALTALARENLDAPLVVAGDFNAVAEHGPLQDLRRLGLRSATDLAGAGWLPTYPAHRVLPPLLPIDHVLVDRRLTATRVETVRVAGTDHLGLLAELGPAEAR